MTENNRDGKIVLRFAGGDHQFRLGIGELEELQEKTDIGPTTLANRLYDGTWRVADVRETIRLGLIGGGASPGMALKLVREHVDEPGNWINNAALAHVIVTESLVGAPEEETGKTEGLHAETDPPNSPTVGSRGAASMESRASSESADPI